MIRNIPGFPSPFASPNLSSLMSASKKSNFIMNGVSVRKEAPELETKRKRHREPGHVPYPLEYTNDMKDFDVWDHMIFTTMCGGMTMHQFETPPTRVLDLGCGGGTWVVAAAKEWPRSTFVGFDLTDMQPDLARSQPESLARRVQWVHGNFLEPLPFGDDEFDFVKIHLIGLGVPEDEWQDVIEEVRRILKPGAVVEIHEEDIIFPSPKRCTPPKSNSTPSLTPTISYSNGCGVSAQTLDRHGNNSNSSSSDYNQNAGTPLLKTSEGQTTDLRDHSALEEAFTQMLSSRFINLRVLSILPFYLRVAFEDVLIYPGLKTYLPPPSAVPSQTNGHKSEMTYRQSMDSGILVDVPSMDQGMRISDSVVDRAPLMDYINVRTQKSASLMNPSSARMGLARALRMVVGCKEAMWVEYEKLNRDKRPKPNPRLDREDFETHFSNYECDMQDRINMRSNMKMRLAWEEPAALERPQWQVWRDKEAKEGFPLPSSDDSQGDVCRNKRGYVCRKQIHRNGAAPSAS